jgi:SAM-dependent methyltransferase
MAHDQQQEFFRRIKNGWPDLFSVPIKVLEVGSQNINGSVREAFHDQCDYIGIDLGMAKDVDWVIPGELVELPDGWADVVVSTECFEHCVDWHKVFLNMLRIARKGALIIVTAASHGRPVHGTLDSEQGSSPFTASYYKNLGVDDFIEKIRLGFYFNRHGFEVDSPAGDLYFWGIRSETNFEEPDQHWQDSLQRLARAQGQLAQAAHRHVNLRLQLNEAEAELAALRQQLEQALQIIAQARQQAEAQNAYLGLVPRAIKQAIRRLKGYWRK